MNSDRLLFIHNLFFRQGYAEDYSRSNRSAYEDYYASYYKQYMGKQGSCSYRYNNSASNR